MKDNLESFFRKHLSDESPGEDNWNVPSDEVWKNVLPEIQKKKGIFIPWKYFYMLGSVILAAFIITLFMPAGRDNLPVSDKETVVSKTENTPQNRNKNAGNSSLTRSGIPEEKAQADFNDENVSSQKNPSFPAGPAKNKTSVAKVPERPGSVHVKNQAETYIEDFVATGPAGFVRVESAATIAFLTPRLSRLTIRDTVEIQEDERKILTEEPETPREPVELKGKFGAGLIFLPTLTSTYLTGEMVPGLIKTENMFLYSTNYGLELKYYISNRFALVTGVESSEIKSRAKSMVDFAYDNSTEKPMPGGLKQNTSAVPMPTPFGEIETEITYQFSASDTLPDGEPMQSEMETRQSVIYFSIPLGVEFNMLRHYRFNWLAEGGLRYSRAIKDATSFSSRILHLGNEMEVVEQQMVGHPSYTVNYLGFYLGTGVNYKLSGPFQIGASARYFGSITQINLQENMSTYVHGFNLKLGIIYFF